MAIMKERTRVRVTWVKKSNFFSLLHISAIQGGHQEVAQKLPELLIGNIIWMYILLNFLILANKIVSS